MLKYFLKIKQFTLDVLFPIVCLSCRKDDFWLCPECLEKIPILNFQICPKCEKIISEQGQLCQICKNRRKKEPFYLDALVSSVKYGENNVSKMIHLFKYNFIPDLSAPLGKILTKGLLKSDLPLPDFIAPVPLHPLRLRFRGFNQANLLAKEISRNLTPGFEIPVLSDLLIRKKHTQPQMKIKKYAERQKNIKNSFAINPAFLKKIKNKQILLIDDVATTSATLLECAKILKNNGAKKVFAGVIARQEFKKIEKSASFVLK